MHDFTELTLLRTLPRRAPREDEFLTCIAIGFNPQDPGDRRQAERNLAFVIEHALWHGDSASIAPPWGDGEQAFTFDGVETLRQRGVPEPERGWELVIQEGYEEREVSPDVHVLCAWLNLVPRPAS